MNVCSQMSLSAIVSKAPLRITIQSQILWRMVGLVEFYSYRETPAVALFMIIYIHTCIYLYVCIYMSLYIMYIYIKLDID